MTWYDLDPARLVLEHWRVSERFPRFVLKRESNELYWEGETQVRVGEIIPAPLVIRVKYPESFPACYPNVYILAPNIPALEVGHDWHRWPSDGSICYVEPKEWQMGTTADEIIAKAEDWYFNYVAVKSGLIPKMPDMGRASLSRSS